jgi:hypothetical protein
MDVIIMDCSGSVSEAQLKQGEKCARALIKSVSRDEREKLEYQHSVSF